MYQSPKDIPFLLKRAAESDLVIKHSGVGVNDALLEEASWIAGLLIRRWPSGMWMPRPPWPRWKLTR